MKKYYCRYCGNDSTYIDVDYLVGNDHLQCVLKAMDEAKKPKVMKIKNFDKISGYTYKGYAIVNPVHNAGETKYMADVLDLNLPHKPKWELNVLTPDHKWLGLGSDPYYIMLTDENKNTINRTLTKKEMKLLPNFRRAFEEMVDELLKIRLTSAPMYSSHSIQTNGILNSVNNNGSTIPYGQMIQSQQSLQQQILQLTKMINGGSK